MYKLYVLTEDEYTELECSSLEDGKEGVDEYINDLVEYGGYENDFFEIEEDELKNYHSNWGVPVYGKRSSEYDIVIIVSKV